MSETGWSWAPLGREHSEEPKQEPEPHPLSFALIQQLSRAASNVWRKKIIKSWATNGFPIDQQIKYLT